MQKETTIKPVAYINTPFKEKFGIPRQSGRVKAKGEIVFYKEFSDINAIRGIEKFSHLWIIFDFSLSHTEKFSPTVRPPRLGGNERVGVFASRSPFRPNSLGLSSVKLEKVNYQNKKLSLTVSGVDLLDKTPIYDIKPYLPLSDLHKDATNGYAEKEKEHKIKVIVPKKITDSVKKEELDLIKACIKEDPKPSYKTEDEIYGFKIFNYEVKFSVKGNTATIIEIIKIK